MSGFIQLAHPAFWQVVLLRRDNEGGNNKVRARPAPVMRLFKLPAEVSAFVQVNVRCHGLINEKTPAFRLRPITGLASRFRLSAGVFSACRWAWVGARKSGAGCLPEHYGGPTSAFGLVSKQGHWSAPRDAGARRSGSPCLPPRRRVLRLAGGPSGDCRTRCLDGAPKGRTGRHD